MNSQTIADQIEALLPQTQCTQCGYAGCRPYAEAIAAGAAEINQCPPGGQVGISKLAHLLRREPLPLNPAHGQEEPLQLAVIEEEHCIGCTLCIQACPVDAIVGAPRQMHVVLADLCTGCKLCIAPCPVDCIRLKPAPWPWSESHAAAARQRFEARKQRLIREKNENEARLAAKAQHKLHEINCSLTDVANAETAASSEQQRKKAIIEAALERARLRREQSQS